MRTIGTFDTVHLINASPKALLFAALDPAEYEDEHIPDSHRIDCDRQDCLDQIHALLRNAPRHTPIVLYGRDADDDRPARTAYHLEREGFRDVQIYADGLAGWHEAGYAFGGSGREEHLGLGFEANEALHHGDWSPDAPGPATGGSGPRA
jgi:rhodanese-related sulfurtransferase